MKSSTRHNRYSSRRSRPEAVADRQVETADGTLVVALTGQPNVGKSTIFNLLTGLDQHVGNWPGKTVARKTGFCSFEGVEYEIVDLPGTYSLTANSVEERITRDYIIHESPDIVVAVVDAAIPERSLYLLAELILLPAPVVLALNMMDVAEQEGLQIEPDVLEAALGIPVIPMSATQNEGIREMLEAIQRVCEGTYPYNPRRPTIRPDHQAVLADLIALVADYVPENYPVDWVALKLLEGDEEIADLIRKEMREEQWQTVDRLLYTHEDAILDIAGARYEWIARMIRAAVVRPRVGQVGLTARLDSVLTHPIWGTLMLIGVLGFVFWLTYSIGNPIQGWLDGQLGLLAEQARNLLGGRMGWFSDLVADGLIGGAGMVVTFLPILVIFFTVLGFLEDTGYMARAAYVTDRFMHLVGLHGKSFMPLLLGFGCNVPGVLGARIIESRRSRLLTILLAPIVPCTAQLAVVTILASALFGDNAGWVAWGLVTVNMVVLAGLGILLNRFVLKGDRAAFVMELPLYHLPNLRTIFIYVWQNILAFLEKAGTVILLASLVVWFLSYFPAAGDISQSYLARGGQFLAPLGHLMGLPWQMLVALLASFVAKENTIATLGVLYGDFRAILPEVLSLPAALSFLFVQMLFVPCVATVAAMKQESESWGWTLFGLVMLLVVSVGGGILIYQLGTSMMGGI